MGTAPYVKRGGEQVFRQPFLARGVRFYGFTLSADAGQLQKAVCDPSLNAPTRGQEDFRPAGPCSVLVFCDLQSLSCTTPPDSNKGWFREQEGAFWLLLNDHRRDRLVWFHPYIFVDNSYALSMGRELYGFPKGLGWFQIPEGDAQAGPFTLDTVVLKAFSPETQGTRERLFEVRLVAERAAEQRDWSHPRDMMRDLVQLLKSEGNLFDDFRLAGNLVDDLIHGRVPMVFLKQFRDVANPDIACYQSIVEVSCRITRFGGGGLLHHEYEVDIGDFASHPVRRDLGLADGPLRPILNFWCEFDFEIGYGTEIWKPE
jgi:hypothetical protein